MFLSILVGVDDSPSSWRALEIAIELARAGNATLTLMTVAPPLSMYVTLGGVSPQTMTEQLDAWAGDILERAAGTAPDDVLVHRVQARGHAGPELVKEMARGRHDLIVLGSRGRGRAQEGLLGSVNTYVHYHGRIPLLTVPDPGDGAG